LLYGLVKLIGWLARVEEMVLNGYAGIFFACKRKTGAAQIVEVFEYSDDYFSGNMPKIL
jgi:hypothetical protein